MYRDEPVPDTSLKTIEVQEVTSLFRAMSFALIDSLNQSRGSGPMTRKRPSTTCLDATLSGLISFR
jgi:hypothetical protein